MLISNPWICVHLYFDNPTQKSLSALPEPQIPGKKPFLIKPHLWYAMIKDVRTDHVQNHKVTVSFLLMTAVVSVYHLQLPQPSI